MDYTYQTTCLVSYHLFPLMSTLRDCVDVDNTCAAVYMVRACAFFQQHSMFGERTCYKYFDLKQ